MTRLIEAFAAGLALALLTFGAAGADEASLVRPSPSGFVFVRPYVSKGSTVMTYVELPQGAGADGKIGTRVIMVPAADYAVRGRTNITLVTNQSFDCEARSYRVDKAEFYDEQANLLFDLPYGNDWRQVEKDSAAEATLLAVCEPPATPGRTLPDFAAVRADALLRRSDAR